MLGAGAAVSFPKVASPASMRSHAGQGMDWRWCGQPSPISVRTGEMFFNRLALVEYSRRLGVSWLVSYKMSLEGTGVSHTR